MAYVDSMGKLKDDFYVDRGYHNKPAVQKSLGPYGGPEYPSDSEYPSPFGTDLFDRVEAPTPGKQFLDGFLMAHVNPEGTAHDWKAPGHGGLPVPGGFVNPHGRRGTNTFPSGRAKYSPSELKLMEEMGY